MWFSRDIFEKQRNKWSCDIHLNRTQQRQHSLGMIFKIFLGFQDNHLTIEEIITNEHQREKMIYFEGVGGFRPEGFATVQ